MRDAGASARDPLALLAGAVLGGLPLAVMSVGGVAIYAESANSWDHYFLMERTVAAATPVVGALLVAAGVVCLGAVLRW